MVSCAGHHKPVLTALANARASDTQKMGRGSSPTVREGSSHAQKKPRRAALARRQLTDTTVALANARASDTLAPVLKSVRLENLFSATPL